MTKQYIGDSVYVDFDGNALILTTDNGLGPSNTIYIDAEVWSALTKYVEDLKKEGANRLETDNAEQGGTK